MEYKLDSYYMTIALAASFRSTCTRAMVGAVIVNDGQLISTGYNGSPSGMPHCSEIGCIVIDGHCISTVHAEQNAIIQAGKSAKGSTLYTTHLCCFECCKFVINAKIQKVVYAHDYTDEKCKLYNVSNQMEFLGIVGIECYRVNILKELYGHHHR
ncbi:MAG TPA: dCMP deaminase family protein [Cyclobacteriaceae bacterium]|jgi:dCMP deaminase|nr:dCMP deaminase family protein [Cyclobacteriaceae bacterium]